MKASPMGLRADRILRRDSLDSFPDLVRAFPGAGAKKNFPHCGKSKFREGDHVVHRPQAKDSYGEGVIQHRWGCWSYCRECNHDLPAADYAECHCCGDMERVKRIKDMILARYVWRCQSCLGETEYPRHAFCPHCHEVVFVLSINGRDIFDVLFGREVISVNQCWLRKIKLK